MHRMDTKLAKRFKGRPGEPAAKAVERAGVRATYELHDRMLSNSASRRKLKDAEPTLDATQQGIVRDLSERGVSVQTFSEVFASRPGLWEGLQADASTFVEATETTLAAEREAAASGEPVAPKKGKKGKKGSFLRRSLPRGAELAADNPWLQLGADPRILDMVNRYLGMWSKLSYVDLWYTVPSKEDAERQSSQRWHRDYNDKHLVKVFLYLSDVDEGAGPFEYVVGSAGEGPYAGSWPWRPLGDTYPPDNEFGRKVPESAMLTLTGEAGTIIFCNTSGFHRGGFATHRPRVMAVLNYVSPASLESLSQRNFKVSADALSGLSPAQRFALS